MFARLPGRRPEDAIKDDVEYALIEELLNAGHVHLCQRELERLRLLLRRTHTERCSVELLSHVVAQFGPKSSTLWVIDGDAAAG